MRLFGILLILFILLAGGGYVYFATQDWKGRQQITAAGLRHLLLLQGLPLEGEDFNAEDETPFEVPMAGGESTKTVSKKLLENYFKDNTSVGVAPGVDPVPAARVSLATNTPVISQSAEVKRVIGLLKVELGKATTPAQKIALVEGWLLLQAEMMTERVRYQLLISPTVQDSDKIDVPKTPEQLATDADELIHALDLKFYRVMPKLYESPESALSPARWQALQKQTETGLQPPISTDDADRLTRLSHLLVHLDRDAAWQKRVVVIVGLRRYVQVLVAQFARFREMRDHVDLPIAADQATFQKNQDYLINEARQNVDRARATAAAKAKLVDQKTAADDAVSRRRTHLDDLKAQLQKVRPAVDSLLVQQGVVEQDLFKAQRLVALTLEDVYRLEALLIEVERERYGLSPTRP